ncbi:MAG TPA: hypothetical protein VHC63_17125 [Acidimicrobiales bacterium]|nr:hypothetical protein [Acidimicrobiales bacterium]
MASPLDEYPVHQLPLSLSYVGTSDRNFYDRCIYQAHDRSGDVLLITGMGVYPNLGVIDAFAVVRRGDTQVCVRASDALPDNRLVQSVGPFSIEVDDPLRSLHLSCAHTDLAFELTFSAAFAAMDEPHHVHRMGPKILLDASRFCQVGAVDGELRVGTEEFELGNWTGTRDRSWGIRPVGEAEPPGRTAAEDPIAGFWWVWTPLRFDDFALMVIAQESADGHRILNEAVRVWGDGRSEQLGWPEFAIRYTPGTRHPTGATIGLRNATLEIETFTSVPLNVGCGYGGDPDWNHGLWKGRDWVESVTYDLTDPLVAGRIPFGVIDHVARGTLDGQEGWGIFEHGTFGAHAPSGFTDWDSVAP